MGAWKRQKRHTVRGCGVKITARLLWDCILSCTRRGTQREMQPMKSSGLLFVLYGDPCTIRSCAPETHTKANNVETHTHTHTHAQTRRRQRQPQHAPTRTKVVTEIAPNRPRNTSEDRPHLASPYLSRWTEASQTSNHSTNPKALAPEPPSGQFIRTQFFGPTIWWRL